MLDRQIIRVVVVDDHRMFLDSLVRLLEDEADIEVVAVAGSSADAVASVAATGPDVVIVDYQLPDESGAKTTTSLRAAHPHLPVVMLTGQADTSAARAASEVGCAAFITKDRAAQDLVDAIRSAYESAGADVVAGPLATPGAPALGASAGLVAGWEGARATRLSRREREVLGLLADGAGTDTISELLYISRNTVRAHVQRVITKLGAHSKLEAVAVARRRGLL